MFVCVCLFCAVRRLLSVWIKCLLRVRVCLIVFGRFLFLFCFLCVSRSSTISISVSFVGIDVDCFLVFVYAMSLCGKSGEPEVIVALHRKRLLRIACALQCSVCYASCLSYCHLMRFFPYNANMSKLQILWRSGEALSTIYSTMQLTKNPSHYFVCCFLQFNALSVYEMIALGSST